jgi:uncharacterized membrane protein AbrB (regulator of aidB expression)
LTIVAVLSVIGRGMPSAQYLATVAAVVYGAAIGLGIPTYLLCRVRRWRSIYFHVGAALLVAIPLLVIAALLTEGATLPFVAALGTATGGVVFHAISERCDRRKDV